MKETETDRDRQTDRQRQAARKGGRQTDMEGREAWRESKGQKGACMRPDLPDKDPHSLLLHANTSNDAQTWFCVSDALKANRVATLCSSDCQPTAGVLGAV